MAAPSAVPDVRALPVKTNPALRRDFPAERKDSFDRETRELFLRQGLWFVILCGQRRIYQRRRILCELDRSRVLPIRLNWDWRCGGGPKAWSKAHSF